MFDALEEVFSAVMNWFDSPAAHAFDVSEFIEHYFGWCRKRLW